MGTVSELRRSSGTEPVAHGFAEKSADSPESYFIVENSKPN